MKLRVGILSLGCPRNLVDSETILGRLNTKGYTIVDLEHADVVILNTCGFIEDAKKESIDAMLDLIGLKESGKLKKIIVYGCLSQRYYDLLRKEFPQVDAFVGRVSLNHASDRLAVTPRHYAYLKICEGCINDCSYCVIPKIKGRFTSLKEKDIIEKFQRLTRNGAKEINIVGQDITAYGKDFCYNGGLTRLIKKLVGVSRGLKWIRLLYLHPNRIDKELLEVIRGEKKICKYIDMPIQHINDRILKSMNRKISKKEIMLLIGKIRKIIPNAALRTSLILGYPGETEECFKELLDFIKEIKFERLGAFIYSREEGTRASRLKEDVPEKVKKERFDIIMSTQQGIASEVNKRFLGKELEVLVDEAGDNFYLARSQYDAPEVDGNVYIKSNKSIKEGDFLKVNIIDSLEYDLIGKAL